MSTQLLTPLAGPVTDDAPVKSRKPRTRLGDRILHIYTWLIIAWLMLPIAVVIVFSFNKPKGRLNTVWQGFTWSHYPEAFKDPDIRAALFHSLEIAAVAVVGAGLIGSLIGLAMGRYRFRGQGAMNLVMFATISSPELVMGASLLTLFLEIGLNTGFLTVAIAHVMFSISFVASVVRARVLSLDRSIEEAARDLGASPLTTFRLITFPMILPAVLSGALLTIALSIDDFIITDFTAGNQFQTLPLWIWGTQRFGVPPTVNVVGTLLFLVGLIVAGASSLSGRRGAQRP